MQPRTMPIWRALIVPVVFIVWGISRIGFGHQNSVWPLVAWIAAALVLLPLGVLTPRPFERRSHDRADHPSGQPIRPGPQPDCVFASQYAVGVISAIDAGDRALAIIAGRAISGATAGYFIGSTIALLLAYRRKSAER